MEKKDKEITVKQSQLDEMMAKIERLEAVASKQRLANFDAKRQEETGKVINLRMIDGRVIISWGDMLKNIVEKSPEGVWREDQQVELVFEDGKKEKMFYVIFMRRYALLPMEIKKEIKNEDGTTTFIGKTADEKEYKINEKFVN